MLLDRRSLWSSVDHCNLLMFSSSAHIDAADTDVPLNRNYSSQPTEAGKSVFQDVKIIFSFFEMILNIQIWSSSSSSSSSAQQLLLAVIDHC